MNLNRPLIRLLFGSSRSLLLIFALACLSFPSFGLSESSNPISQPRGTTGRYTIRTSDYLSKNDPRFKNSPPIPGDGFPFPLEVKNLSSKCHVVLGRPGCAPEFVIAGSMKCGTTSLYSYLLEHPKVLSLETKAGKEEHKKAIKAPLASKEVRFFNTHQYNGAVKSLGLLEAIHGYLNLFQDIQYSPDLDEQEITGEATPMYVVSFYHNIFLVQLIRRRH